ncbi:WbqC-like protein family protein [Stieleria maiorica]|uniref:WbqC-like protein family protein n=1 Tax=Stieleria maiorica TaxID=2795974 RepID=A0A5B9MD26_9BACT|nr:WbqC family protein [Stieleria maiorica]QEF98683.1 WbqC-like protein family protein [Stieleria maiorica]
MGEKRIAIMQPYFFPYIGYFHLLHAADSLVLYDNLQYTKKGWINRNRMLHNGGDVLFSIPLRKASDYASIDQREVSTDFDRRKLLNRVRAAYRKAPNFAATMNLFTTAIDHPESNLFRFVKHSIQLLCDHLGIRTSIIDSSNVPIDHSMRGQDKVLAICRALEATTYVNAIGGVSLYDQADFAGKGIELRFIQSENRRYQQFHYPFVAWLSILDVLMFNSTETVRDWVENGYTLVANPTPVS